MADETKPATGAAQTPAAGNASTEGTVSKAAHDELAGRLGSAMQKLAEAEKAVADFKAKEEVAKRATLESQGEFQKIAESEKAARVKAEENLAAMRTELETNTKKFSLGIAAKNAGINDVNDAFALIDMAALEIKDGKVNGIEAQIANLQKAKPYLFGGQGAPKAHGDRAGSTPLTKADLLKDYALAAKLAAENPAEYKRIMHG